VQAFIDFAVNADEGSLRAYLRAMGIVYNKMLCAGERSGAADVASLISIGSEILSWIKHGPFQNLGGI